jgi:hypothetical protein
MKSNLLRHTAIYGLLVGIALVLVSIVDSLLGFYGTNKAFGLLNYAVPAAGIIWGALQYRKESEGFMTYGQVVGYGALLSVFSGIITAVYTILLVTVIDPGYVDRVQVLAAEQMYAMGTLTDQQIDQALEVSAKMMRSPSWILFGGLLSSVFIGTVVALIAAIFVRRNRPSTPFDTVE